MTFEWRLKRRLNDVLTTFGATQQRVALIGQVDWFFFHKMIFRIKTTTTTTTTMTKRKWRFLQVLELSIWLDTVVDSSKNDNWRSKVGQLGAGGQSKSCRQLDDVKTFWPTSSKLSEMSSSSSVQLSHNRFAHFFLRLKYDCHSLILDTCVYDTLQSNT